jgi:hypothetical protein
LRFTQTRLRERGEPCDRITITHGSRGRRLETQVKLCAGRLPYFLLFGAEKSTLHGWRDEVLEFLQTLRLTLHENKARVFPVKEGFTFLGWRLYPHHRRLRRENVRHAVRRLRRQQAAFACGELSQEELTASVQAWLAHASHGNTYRLRRRIMGRFVFAPQRRGYVQSA